ncbi:hypothetical protein CTI12_AA445940 [Artemisia annua]|uniref:Uncharacterized protein n=1 Tax=Artemisia annua TaxID=35608 RepID=A0A2U1LVY0_ARTAN|nr:hypothetical protein CTI12_AA445940 [Artemisia annua]
MAEVLREKIAWLEATNQDLCRELRVYRSRGIAIDHCEMDTKEPDVLKRSVDSSDYQICEGGDSGVIDEEAAKEWEHTLLKDSMDKELHELINSEIKLFVGFDTMTLKQHFGKKITELEDEK